jgi:hypothetical protein
MELVSGDALELVPHNERLWLEDALCRFGGRFPAVEQIWGLMDEVWREQGCDATAMDARIDAFYSHPVWLLNGLFIEQHPLSRHYRRQMTTWLFSQGPRRVADFGGGFGSLARMIGAACPNAVVDVIEPHPHRLAMALAARTHNVRYCAELSGEYDVLIATDVFEHVPDPLALVAQTAEALQLGGSYLVANCFYPKILCHLSQTFHFRYSWDCALAAMGLVPGEAVSYGRAFTRSGRLTIGPARHVERRSKRLFGLTRGLPRPLARAITSAVLSVRRGGLKRRHHAGRST